MSEQVKVQGATLERQALAALRKMRQKLDEIEHARTEPIAIVGVGCRLPGGANDPEAFWDLLRNGVDAIREVPVDRWKVEEYFDPNPGTPGKTCSRWGGFMDQIDRFDPEFFGISPREAIHMDPQQRIFLEVAWEALENAGIPPSTLKGSSTGVFVGTTMTDYLQQHLRYGNSSDLDAYIISGNTINAISGRLSYFLGTHGPSITMDTACSSSLVAVDRACRSLRDDECTLAIAGGVNLILAPDLFVCMSKWGMLSPDGRCKTFDAAANGVVRAEGCGIIVLKRLGAALANGDRILALIRGSAVNQDGPSSGLSVPNGLAQEAVIRQALCSAHVEPSALTYIEAHGTGTSLGDPIEIDALARVFQPGRNAKTPVALGSVKTNLGHLEAAAGIAGLLKVVLMFEHGKIPPHLHLKQLSRHIAWEKYPFVIPTQLTNWESINRKRIAGISSFGFSGSNAHVILEEAPEAKPAVGGMERPLQLLTISARDEDALRALAIGVEARIRCQPHLPFPDVCFTANAGRSQFGQRLSVLCSTAEEARQKLTAFLTGAAPAGLMTSRLSGSGRPKIAFLFTGQGAQYVNMGLRLYDTSPTFRRALDQCDELLRPHLDRPLLSLLYSQEKQEALLDRTIYTQPAMFALEYALYKLWSSWGLEPNFVLGHSLGEYVAACVAGIFSLEDGLRLIAERARLMQAEPPGGRMVAVSAGEEQVRTAIEPFTRTVSIAAINGPRNVVISGALSDMAAVVNRLAADGVQTKNLNVSHAFHSPLMEPMQVPFEKAVVDIRLQPPSVRLISNLTGRVAKAQEITQPQYWRNHLREPVRFADGMQTLVESGCDIFLELGPSPVLLGMGRQCTTKSNILWLPTLRPGRDDWSESLTSLQSLHHAGVPVNWKGFDCDYPRRKVQLPTYPFQRERFWFESRGEAADDQRANRSPDETGAHPPAAEQEWLFEIQWREAPRPEEVMQEPVDLLSQPGSWLILADERGVAESLRTRLTSMGQRCVLVRPSPRFVREGDDQFALDPANRADFDRLLEEVGITAQTPLRGVQHLWSLDLPDFDAMTGEDLARSQLLCCGAALHLVQALGSLQADVPPCIWLVTQGAHAASDSSAPVHAAMTSLCGLRQVIAAEHPELRCRLLDLEQQRTDDGGEILFREMVRGDLREDALAFRNQSRLVPRLVRLPSATATAAKNIGKVVATKPASDAALRTSLTKLRLRDDATYLITGGLGGLGLETARWMAREGAHNFVLMGRRAPDPKAKAVLDELSRGGVRIAIEQCDVSDEAELNASLNRLSTSMPALRGVVHAAGVLDDGILEQQTWSRFAGVMAAKVRGAWNLHRLTLPYELDFFVLFSAAASLIGSSGQGNYAAANAFMDGLAHHRKSKGLPALSINWGAWAEVGMAARLAKKDAERWTNRGLRPIQLDEGMAKLGEMLVSSRAQIVAVPIDWSRFFASTVSGRPPSLFSEIFTASGTAISTGEEAPVDEDNLVRRLFSEPAARRFAILKAHVESVASRALGAMGSRSLDPRRPLHELGLDSLMSVELRNALATSLGRHLSSTLLFDYPTVESLTQYLAKNVLNLELTEGTPSEDLAAPDNKDLEELREMSESEAESLLLAELDQLKK